MVSARWLAPAFAALDSRPLLPPSGGIANFNGCIAFPLFVNVFAPTINAHYRRRNWLRRTGRRRLSRGDRQRRALRRRRRRQDRGTEAERPSDLRAGARRAGRAQSVAGTPRVHHRCAGSDRSRRGRVHRGRHAAGRGRIRRSSPRPRRRGARRQAHDARGRGRHQVDGSGRHGDQGRGGGGQAREARRSTSAAIPSS